MNVTRRVEQLEAAQRSARRQKLIIAFDHGDGVPRHGDGAAVDLEAYGPDVDIRLIVVTERPDGPQ